jgi:hypothetical protein
LIIIIMIIIIILIIMITLILIILMIILIIGDYLYVPTFWIHYIVSLTINVQCNTRSGKEKYYDKYISDCGF